MSWQLIGFDYHVTRLYNPTTLKDVLEEGRKDSLEMVVNNKGDFSSVSGVEEKKSHHFRGLYKNRELMEKAGFYY